MSESNTLLEAVAEALWMETANFISVGTPFWAAPALAKDMYRERAQAVIDHINQVMTEPWHPDRCAHMWIPIAGGAWCPDCDTQKAPPT